MSGGCSHTAVRLPRPRRSVGVRIGGGAHDVELVRPAGVPVRVRIGGGSSKLAIDDFRLRAGGGKTDWRSPDYDLIEDRYDIEIGAERARSPSERDCGRTGRVSRRKKLNDGRLPMGLFGTVVAFAAGYVAGIKMGDKPVAAIRDVVDQARERASTVADRAGVSGESRRRRDEGCDGGPEAGRPGDPRCHDRRSGDDRVRRTDPRSRGNHGPGGYRRRDRRGRVDRTEASSRTAISPSGWSVREATP